MIASANDLRVLFATLLGSLLFAGSVYADAAKPDTASVKESLNNKLIPGMHIDALTIADKRANINGTAARNSDVSQFLRNVDNSPSFDRVELVSINQKNNNVQFNIVVDVLCPAAADKNSGENLCSKQAAKGSAVFKCKQGSGTVFQDRPCTK